MNKLESPQRERLEQDHHNILKGLADVILLRDGQGRCLEVISGAADKLYRPADEMVGKTLHESLPKPQADIILGYIQESLALQKPVRGEYTLIVAGKPIAFSAAFSPIGEDTVIIITHDVTELKKVEMQLSVYAFIIRNLTEGICLIRASDDTIVYANPKLESMFGYRSCELIGEDAAILRYSKINEGDRSQQHHNQSQLYKESTYELHSVKKEGEDFWCRVKTSGLEHSQFGRVYVTVYTDITAERKHQLNLELLKSLTKDISEADNLEAKLGLVLQKVCESHEWIYGEAWIFSDREGVLRCSPKHYIRPEPNRSTSSEQAQNILSTKSASPSNIEKFRTLSQTFTFPPSIGLPGRVYTSRKPEWHIDVSTLSEDNFLRKSIAIEYGIKTGLGIPLVANNHVLAVLVFFRTTADPIDHHLIANLCAIASQIDLDTKCKQLEKQLSQTQQLLKTTLDCIEQASLIVSKNSQIQYLNASAQTLLGLQSIDRKSLSSNSILLADIFDTSEESSDQNAWIISPKTNEKLSSSSRKVLSPKLNTVLIDKLGNKIATCSTVKPIRSEIGQIVVTLIQFKKHNSRDTAQKI